MHIHTDPHNWTDPTHPVDGPDQGPDPRPSVLPSVGWWNDYQLSG